MIQSQKKTSYCSHKKTVSITYIQRRVLNFPPCLGFSWWERTNDDDCLSLTEVPFLIFIDTSTDQIRQDIDNYLPDHTSDTNFEETLSTLKYAHTTKSVNNRPVMNIDQDPKDKMIRWQNINRLIVGSETRAN